MKWNDTLWLLTLDELREIPDGSMLLTINDDYVTTPTSDDDTRFGFTAYGLTRELAKEQDLEELFLKFLL